MGILNITPDSFSDGGRFFDGAAARDRALAIVEEGADILDVGGESTRPGADPVPAEEEIRRVVPLLRAVADALPVPVSIDTAKATVAERALEAGAAMVNDVTGFHGDPDLPGVVADFGVPVVLMHMKGTPRTMQESPHYDDLFGEITAYLSEGVDRALRAGVAEDRILVDPGIGFGKTVDHNLRLLDGIGTLKEALGLPVLVGPSRKSFIGKILDLPPEERVEGTSAAVAVAVVRGCDVVRVHDVTAMSRVVRVVDAIMGKGSGDKRAAPLCRAGAMKQ